MRTTLTLDNDVAARLEQSRKRMNLSIKQLVNMSLRLELDQLESANKPGTDYKIESVSLGVSKLPNLDNTAEVLALMEATDAD